MRGFVFIDGSNFYFKLKQLSGGLGRKVNLLDFDFRPLRLAGCAAATYRGALLIGAVKQDGSEKAQPMYADQQRLLSTRRKASRRSRPPHSPSRSDLHEKGVDVRLAVEMIRLAREDRYDQAYFLSSDTDLVPAVEEVQSFGKTVQYVGVPKGQSYGLSKVADDVRLAQTRRYCAIFQARILTFSHFILYCSCQVLDSFSCKRPTRRCILKQ